MAPLSGPEAELYALEESLWLAETRFDPDYMESVLMPDCVEFGRSGRVYDRAQMLGICTRQSAPIDIDLPLHDFTVRTMGRSVALVTYVSVVVYDTLETSHRSSLWVRSGGRWRLAFHQGTPTLLS